MLRRSSGTAVQQAREPSAGDIKQAVPNMTASEQGRNTMSPLLLPVGRHLGPSRSRWSAAMPAMGAPHVTTPTTVVQTRRPQLWDQPGMLAPFSGPRALLGGTCTTAASGVAVWGFRGSATSANQALQPSSRGACVAGGQQDASSDGVKAGGVSGGETSVDGSKHTSSGDAGWAAAARRRRILKWVYRFEAMAIPIIVSNCVGY